MLWGVKCYEKQFVSINLQILCEGASVPFPGCPKGQHVQGFDAKMEKPLPNATCVQCETGSYNNFQGYNTFNKCSGCSNVCDPRREDEVIPCTPTTDRQCVCKEGYRQVPSSADTLRCVDDNKFANITTTTDDYITDGSTAGQQTGMYCSWFQGVFCCCRIAIQYNAFISMTKSNIN